MCTKKLPDGQENPTFADCYECRPKDKIHLDKYGRCPKDLVQEKYGIPVGDVINID